jgi:hypothetical protein
LPAVRSTKGARAARNWISKTGDRCLRRAATIVGEGAARRDRRHADVPVGHLQSMASPSSRLSTVGANANGVLVTGTSGAEFGIRGFIDGWDPETGKQLWRRYTIPARGEKGNETWPQDNNAWEIGGGSAWITRSYDTELDLMYWGIGNPAPWASQSRPGDAFTPRRCWRCGGRPARSSGIISSLRMIRMTPLTGQKKWRVPLTDRPIWSAMLTTGGGILFTGKEIGEFIALDIESGQQVWQF